MIILAHDGSIYGDWVARYALQFAMTEADRKLLILHVEDGQIAEEIVSVRLSGLQSESVRLGIQVHIQRLPAGPSVYRALRQAIPHDPGSLVICGTRVKPRHRRYLTGSISAQLLRIHQCPVLALRVVQPGSRGMPRELFLPLGGHRQEVVPFASILKRLAAKLRFVQLCRIMLVNPLRHPHLSLAMERELRRRGNLELSEIRRDLETILAPLPFRCDQRVVIASDWGNEVLTQASRLKADLMLLGLGERRFASRILRGGQVERILHETPCDVGIYRST